MRLKKDYLLLLAFAITGAAYAESSETSDAPVWQYNKAGNADLDESSSYEFLNKCVKRTIIPALVMESPDRAPTCAQCELMQKTGFGTLSTSNFDSIAESIYSNMNCMDMNDDLSQRSLRKDLTIQGAAFSGVNCDCMNKIKDNVKFYVNEDGKINNVGLNNYTDILRDKVYKEYGKAFLRKLKRQVETEASYPAKMQTTTCFSKIEDYIKQEIGGVDCPNGRGLRGKKKIRDRIAKIFGEKYADKNLSGITNLFQENLKNTSGNTIQCVSPATFYRISSRSINMIPHLDTLKEIFAGNYDSEIPFLLSAPDMRRGMQYDELRDYLRYNPRLRSILESEDGRKQMAYLLKKSEGESNEELAKSLMKIDIAKASSKLQKNCQELISKNLKPLLCNKDEVALYNIDLLNQATYGEENLYSNIEYCSGNNIQSNYTGGNTNESEPMFMKNVDCRANSAVYCQERIKYSNTYLDIKDEGGDPSNVCDFYSKAGKRKQKKMDALFSTLELNQELIPLNNQRSFLDLDTPRNDLTAANDPQFCEEMKKSCPSNSSREDECLLNYFKGLGDGYIPKTAFEKYIKNSLGFKCKGPWCLKNINDYTSNNTEYDDTNDKTKISRGWSFPINRPAFKKSTSSVQIAEKETSSSAPNEKKSSSVSSEIQNYTGEVQKQNYGQYSYVSKYRPSQIEQVVNGDDVGDLETVEEDLKKEIDNQIKDTYQEVTGKDAIAASREEMLKEIEKMDAKRAKQLQEIIDNQQTVIDQLNQRVADLEKGSEPVQQTSPTTDNSGAFVDNSFATPLPGDSQAASVADQSVGNQLPMSSSTQASLSDSSASRSPASTSDGGNNGSASPSGANQLSLYQMSNANEVASELGVDESKLSLHYISKDEYERNKEKLDKVQTLVGYKSGTEGVLAIYDDSMNITQTIAFKVNHDGVPVLDYNNIKSKIFGGQEKKRTPASVDSSASKIEKKVDKEREYTVKDLNNILNTP